MSGTRPPHRRTRLADLDYIRALRASKEMFGESQARIYQRLLDEAIDAVAAEPRRLNTKERDELRPGVRSLRIKALDPKATARHILYYRVAADGVVEILRILHDRMEPSRRFP